MVLRCDVGGWIGPQPALPFPQIPYRAQHDCGCCIAFSLLGEESGIRLPDVWLAKAVGFRCLLLLFFKSGLHSPDLTCCHACLNSS